MPGLIRMHPVITEKRREVAAGKETSSYVYQAYTLVCCNPVQLQVIHLVPIPYRAYTAAEPPEDIVSALSTEARADIREKLQ